MFAIRQQARLLVASRGELPETRAERLRFCRLSHELAIELVVPLPGFIKRRAEGKIIGTALRELKRKVESDEATRGVASSE